MSCVRLFHGGKPGLRPGDILLGGHERKLHPGCAWCEARKNGEAFHGMDPPSLLPAVYVTPERLYAMFYASLYGWGDLYVVEPLGPLVPSKEDHVPAFACLEGARVTTVYKRNILLTMSERRRLWRLWKAADEAVGAQAHP